MQVEDIDQEFEESYIKVVSIKSFPGLQVEDEFIGPFEEGKEYKVRYWIASKLAEEGIVKIVEEPSIKSLQEIYWKEIIQPGKHLLKLPTSFFPKVRRYLKKLKEEKSEEYGRALRIVTDIVSCRLRKIVGLAISSSSSPEILNELTIEEKSFFEFLKREIEEFKLKMLGESGSY